MNSDGTNQQLVTNNNFNEWVVVWRPTGSTGIGDRQDESKFPNGIKLLQNYPNPFNPSTKISYQIPEMSYVTLKVMDILGNEIETLVSEEKPAGAHELRWYSGGLPSGVYFYQLLVSALQSKDGRAKEFIDAKKMIIIK